MMVDMVVSLKCCVLRNTCYNVSRFFTVCSMIKSFKHRGLERLFLEKDASGVPPHHAERIRNRLIVLDSAEMVEHLNLPGWRLHRLEGKKKSLFSIRVTGNWRITFEFIDGDAYIVNYEDYH